VYFVLLSALSEKLSASCTIGGPITIEEDCLIGVSVFSAPDVSDCDYLAEDGKEYDEATRNPDSRDVIVVGIWMV
jgi:hypothetical protein